MAVEPLPSTLLRDRMPEWWRPFTLDLDGAILAQRRRAVEALRTALSPSVAVDAVAYAHGDASVGWRIIDVVRRAVRGIDSHYEGRAGDAEPPAMVSAALAGQLTADPDADLSTLISLLVLNAAGSGLRPAIADMDLAALAVSQLEHRAAAEREIAQPPRSASALVRDALAHTGGAEPGGSAAILAALARRIDELAAETQRGQAVLRECLARVSWADQSWCESAQAVWDDLEPAARPVIAAIELADRTCGITPAADAPALLAAKLAGAHLELVVAPTTAVAAAAPHLEGRLARVPHPELFPFADALRRWRAGESAAGSDAVGNLETDAGRWGEPAVAEQVYREVLALRGLADE